MSVGPCAPLRRHRVIQRGAATEDDAARVHHGGQGGAGVRRGQADHPAGVRRVQGGEQGGVICFNSFNTVSGRYPHGVPHCVPYITPQYTLLSIHFSVYTSQYTLLSYLWGPSTEVVNADERCRNLLQVVFIPNFNVSLAELIMPASDISQHISTAGMEASGTGNMKFVMNGGLIVGRALH